MNRYLFWLFAGTPFALLTIYINLSESPDSLIPVLLMSGYLPVVYNIRRKYLGMQVKDVFKSFIPFYGYKERYRLHFG
jgi:hypothetical protein